MKANRGRDASPELRLRSPTYTICRSPDFEDDVVAIFGDMDTFERVFEGYAFNLSRLPRGKGTWDLSPIGDYRLAVAEPGILEGGVAYPGCFFTFQLTLGSLPQVTLLRAFRAAQLLQPG